MRFHLKFNFICQVQFQWNSLSIYFLLSFFFRSLLECSCRNAGKCLFFLQFVCFAYLHDSKRSKSCFCFCLHFFSSLLPGGVSFKTEKPKNWKFRMKPLCKLGWTTTGTNKKKTFAAQTLTHVYGIPANKAAVQQVGNWNVRQSSFPCRFVVVCFLFVWFLKKKTLNTYKWYTNTFLNCVRSTLFYPFFFFPSSNEQNWNRKLWKNFIQNGFGCCFVDFPFGWWWTCHRLLMLVWKIAYKHLPMEETEKKKLLDFMYEIVENPLLNHKAKEKSARSLKIQRSNNWIRSLASVSNLECLNLRSLNDNVLRLGIFIHRSMLNRLIGS